MALAASNRLVAFAAWLTDPDIAVGTNLLTGLPLL